MQNNYEAELSFVYKTVLSYSKYEDYTIQKLSGKYPKAKIYEGYLIDKKYYDYWKKYTDYDIIKQTVQCTQYKDARGLIYKYRKTNRYKGYQNDAKQVIFKTPEELFEAVRAQGKAYVLIDYNFWNLICEEGGLKERGGVRFSLDCSKITMYFGEFDYIEIITKDNIIDHNKDMILSGADIVRKEDKEEEELKKLLLLYAFEQELKYKLSNRNHIDNEFQEYFLISKEWISLYKQFYHYDEICKMIEKNEKLKRMLCNGYIEARRNLPLIIKNIVIKEKQGFPETLRDNNTFLAERVEQVVNRSNQISYWRNLEPINEELKALFSYSELHQYAFNDSSFAGCIIIGGKFIINLSTDEFNPNDYALEVGTIDSRDFTYKDEYLLHYRDRDAINEDLNYIKNDFDKYEKEYLVFGSNAECDLLSRDGKIYGKGVKLSMHL